VPSQRFLGERGEEKEKKEGGKKEKTTWSCRAGHLLVGHADSLPRPQGEKRRRGKKKKRARAMSCRCPASRFSARCSGNTRGGKGKKKKKALFSPPPRIKRGRVTLMFFRGKGRKILLT